MISNNKNDMQSLKMRFTQYASIKNQDLSSDELVFLGRKGGGLNSRSSSICSVASHSSSDSQSKYASSASLDLKSGKVTNKSTNNNEYRCEWLNG